MTWEWSWLRINWHGFGRTRGAFEPHRRYLAFEWRPWASYVPMPPHIASWWPRAVADMAMPTPTTNARGGSDG